jgi:hypothetical protein
MAENRKELRMKTTLGVFAALLLASTAYLQPVNAQMRSGASDEMSPSRAAPQQPSFGSTGAEPGMQAQLPQGSFRDSCNDLRMEGQTLIAFCPKGDGTWQTTAMGPVSQCIGDIQNVNGELRCNNETGYGSSTPPRPAQPRY